MKTPLQIALENQNKINCFLCSNRTVISSTSFCKLSGKIILDMHLMSNRDSECVDTFSKTDKVKINGSKYLGKIMQHREKDVNIKITHYNDTFVEYKIVGRDTRDSMSLELLVKNYNIWN